MAMMKTDEMSANAMQCPVHDAADDGMSETEKRMRMVQELVRWYSNMQGMQMPKMQDVVR
jgi:hypothetical protein